MKRRVPPGQAVVETVDGTAAGRATIETSDDGCSTEEGDIKLVTTAKVQRSGSKLLSIVGIQPKESGK